MNKKQTLLLSILFLSLIIFSILNSDLVLAQEKDSVSKMDLFYETFFVNEKVNVYATRADGYVEEYKINLKEGIIYNKLYSKPNAEIKLNEEVLMNLLISDNLMQDFFDGVVSGKVKYELVEPKGLFTSMGGFFKNLFGSDKVERKVFVKNKTKELSCSSDEYLENGVCKILLVEDTVTGACSYFDNYGEIKCSNQILEIDCEKLNPISWVSEGQCAIDCEPGMTLCGSNDCKNLLTDLINCGRCGIICSGTDYCLSGSCVVLETCYDEVKNQDETGIDCGGIFCSDCESCDDNNPCTVDLGLPGNCENKPAANNKICGSGKLCQNGECV